MVRTLNPVRRRRHDPAVAAGEADALPGAVPAEVPALVDHRTLVGRHRRDHTRARIVEAAIAVYAQKGPDVPVIDDFVKAARMSRGTFYNHFTTTAELLEATVEWFESRLIKTIVETVHAHPDFAAQAALAMRLYLHWITPDPALCSFFVRMPLVAEVGRREARIRLRQGVDSGAFRVADFDAACDLVFGTLTETIRRYSKAPEHRRDCDGVVRLLLSSLGVAHARVEEIMALPLPEIPVPVRLADMPGAPKAAGR